MDRSDAAAEAEAEGEAAPDAEGEALSGVLVSVPPALKCSVGPVPQVRGAKRTGSAGLEGPGGGQGRAWGAMGQRGFQERLRGRLLAVTIHQATPQAKCPDTHGTAHV